MNICVPSKEDHQPSALHRTHPRGGKQISALCTDRAQLRGWIRMMRLETLSCIVSHVNGIFGVYSCE